MDFKQQLQTWAKGDILQGRIMTVVGILIGAFIIHLLNNKSPMHDGILIPLGLLFLAYVGYGGFLWFSRPKHLQNAQESYQKSPATAIQTELEKAENDHKAYSRLKPIWIGLFIISIGLWFFLSNEYWKGVSLGLIIMSFGGLMIDTFLHRRLKPYLHFLKESI